MWWFDKEKQEDKTAHSEHTPHETVILEELIKTSFKNNHLRSYKHTNTKRLSASNLKIVFPNKLKERKIILAPKVEVKDIFHKTGKSRLKL